MSYRVQIFRYPYRARRPFAWWGYNIYQKGLDGTERLIVMDGPFIIGWWAKMVAAHTVRELMSNS